MAQDKKVFTGGMDKDSEPRLVKQGDYRDALNIRNISSSDSTSGSVENIEGNKLVPYTFISENNEFYEITSGVDPSSSGVDIVEVAESNVLFSQTLTISGKESPSPFNLSISYPNASGIESSLDTGNLSWYGTTEQTTTSNILYNAYGPGGPLSVLNVYDVNTGVPITVTASIDFNPGDILDGNNFNIVFSCSTPGAVFELYFNSSYDDVPGSASLTQMSANPTNQVPINSIEDTYTAYISGSVNYEEVGSGVNPTSGEDDEEITFGPGIVQNDGSVVNLIIEGDSPTDSSVSVSTNVNLYSWDQIGENQAEEDFIVTKVIDFQSEIDSFGVGGDHAFSSNLTSFSGLFTDIIENNKIGDVFSVGTGGSKVSLGSVSTNFTSNTKLEAKDSSSARNSVDSLSYTQLEYFYGSDEILASNGWSINQGTITFDGSSEVASGNSYGLKSPILGGKNYKLTFNVSGLPSGNSFSVKIHDQEYDVISSDGNQEIFLNPPSNAAYIYIEFSSNFGTSDTMTITNARLFLEDVPTNRLSVRIKSSGSTKFNLAFAFSEDQLKQNLSNSIFTFKINEWFPGVSLDLETINSGSVDDNSVSEDYQGLLSLFTQAQSDIIWLTSQIENLTSQHQQELEALNAQLDLDSTQAAADLAALQLAYDTLNTQLNTLSDNYDNLQNIVTSFINNEVDATNVLDVYSATHDDIQEALNTISASITNINAENIANETLQSEIDSLTSFNDAYIAEIIRLEGIITDQNATITSLNDTITANEAELETHQQTIEGLQDDLNAVTADGGYSQEYIDNLSVQHDDIISGILVDYNSQIADLESQLAEALANQDDGIGQDDLDAMQEHIDNLNEAIDSIDEHQQDQLVNGVNQSLTEHISNGDFKDNSNWLGTNWQFTEGVALVDKDEYGTPSDLSQNISTTITKGQYLLSIDCVSFTKGSFDIITLSSSNKDHLTSNHVTINGEGKTVLNVHLNEGVNKIIIRPSKDSKFSIDNLSLKSISSSSGVTLEVINDLLLFINDLSSKNKELIDTNQNLRNVITNLHSELADATSQIEEYTTQLNNILFNFGEMSSSLVDAIAELSLTSTIDQAYIDDVTSSFNNENFSLNEQYDDLIALIQYLTDQINSFEVSESFSSDNDKWLFTISGGLPVTNDPNLIQGFANQELFLKNDSLAEFEPINLGFLFMSWNTHQFRRQVIAGELHFTIYHPGLNILSEVNELDNRALYDEDLKNHTSGEYFQSPNSIVFLLEDIGAVIKYTSYNIPFEDAVINSSGGVWQEGDGDKIIKDQGNIPLSHNTEFLQSEGIDNGLQFSFEILDGPSGFEFYLQNPYNDFQNPLSNNKFIQLASSDETFSWNATNPTSSNYPATLDCSLRFEQVGVASTQSQSRSAESSVEQFVSSAMSENYSLESLQSNGELVYPSQSSDIILNKSQDLPPVIPTSESPARRFVRNTILDTTRVSDISSDNFLCIGSYEDKPKSNVYFFVADTSGRFDCILEYNLVNDVVSTVYQDGRLNNYGVDSDTILNFRKDKRITGISKIDDILYWTDDLNRPRKINVELAKQNELYINNAVKTKDAYYVSGSISAYLSFDSLSKFSVGDSIFAQVGDQTTINFNGYSEVIGICRKMPDDLTFNITSGSPDIVSSVELSDNQLVPGEWIGAMDNTNFPRFYRVGSKSGTTITVNTPPNFSNSSANPLQFNEQNIGALITDNPFQSGGFAAGVIMHADPDDAYSPIISFGNYDDKRQYLDAVKIQPTYRPNTTLELDSSYAKNNILDNLFQFKYRYIHHDNENTSYSPISNINIDPEFARNTPINFTEYLDVANTIIVDYDDSVSDVNKIEVVAREGNDGEFVLIDTVQNSFVKYLKKRKNEILTQAGLDVSDLYNEDKSYIKFRNNGVYPFVDKSDSDKLFDSVPKLAKAQTVLSNNRLAYGNILEGYDNTPLVLSSAFTDDDSPLVQSSKTSFGVYGDNDGTSYQYGHLDYNGSPSSDENSEALNSSVGVLLTEEGWQAGGETFPEDNIGWNPAGGGNLRIRFYIDLASIELNDTDSQTINIDLGMRCARTYSLSGATQKRACRLQMNVDITGLTTINEVRNRIKNKFEQDAWEGGTTLSTTAYSAVSKNNGSVNLENFGATRMFASFNFQANNLDDNFQTGSGISWNSNNAGWKFTQTNSLFQLISGEPGVSTFKSGAFHDFGIAYFDETNRCSFVNVAPDFGPSVELQEAYNTSSIQTSLNGSRPYNPFVTESDGNIGQASGIEFCIYNKPPSWATHYQFFYAGNTSVDEFIQVTVPIAIAGEGNDTQMYLSLQSLKNHKSSYNESTNALIDFDIANGDRIRFISCESNSVRRKFTEYLDFEITGFDLYDEVADASPNGNPIDIASGQEGFYIRIGNPGSETVGLEGASDVSIDHSGFSLATSGYNKLIAEIYRPKKTQESENLVYYEIGGKKEIGGQGISKYHSGDVNQVPEYFYDKDVDTFVSLSPAKVTLREGDVYLKNRNMFTQANGSTLEGFICEDYFLNDFHRTNHYDKGRVNAVNNNAAERRLNASVYYSEAYVSTGAINGLSNFNLANIPYFDYNKDFGSIQHLGNKDNDLIIFHESKVGRVLVGKDILNTASGSGLVSLSNDIIGDYVNLYAGNFGCGLHPESIVKHSHKFYFVDINKGAVLRLSSDGLTAISEYGMKDYFRDLGEMYVKYDPNNIGETSDVDKDDERYLIVGGYDPKYDEYVVTFHEILSRFEGGFANAKPGVWSGNISNWDNLVTKTNQLTSGSDTTIFNAVTVAFSEGVNRWSSFYSFIPEYYAKINKQFITFKQGRLYRQNSSDMYARDYVNFNYFYGNDHLSYIDFIFNSEPSIVKTYNAIGLEGDTKFITGMFSNMGQHYGGYEDVITTSIGFKKVGGLVTCTSTATNPNNIITGDGTEFYSDVAPGDLIRIVRKEGLEVANLIVDKVVSNERILTREDVPFAFENTFMLVIDYKTKEGIHYADIPFCISGIDSLNDNTYHGDGSEIIGLGPTNGVLPNATGSVFRTLRNTQANSFDTNVELNKTSTPATSVVGASYMIRNIGTSGTSGLSGSSVGNLFVYDEYLASSNANLLSTEYKMYIKQDDGTTTFLGYPYSFSNQTYDSEINFMLAPELQDNPDVTIPTPGYLFLVKDGRVEGERMKGSYMRTVLATNSQQSKSKFNLYAANADVDKSELSGR